MYYALSRLAAVDVRWAGLLDTSAVDSFYAHHHNPYCELIVAAEGEITIQTEDHSVLLRPGEALLLRPWETHGGLPAERGKGKFYWAQFACSPGMVEFRLEEAAKLTISGAQRTELRTVEGGDEDPLIVPRQYLPQQRYRLLDLFDRLLATMNNPTGYFRYRATMLMNEMLGLIAEDFLTLSRLDTHFPASYITFRKLVDYLNNSYYKQLKSDELEALLDRKYEYLCQVFKKYTDSTIQHYVHQLSVQRAKHLLLQTNKTVKDIAEDVGFKDPFHFSRTFKKHEGISPQQYRER
jgi:AraC-like DNA-binding protein